MKKTPHERRLAEIEVLDRILRVTSHATPDREVLANLREWLARMARLPEKACPDCGEVPGLGDYYGVHDEVWAAAGYASDQQAHLKCLDARLRKRRGSRLSLVDFTDYPINNGIRWAFDLGWWATGEKP